MQDWGHCHERIIWPLATHPLPTLVAFGGCAKVLAAITQGCKSYVICNRLLGNVVTFQAAFVCSLRARCGQICGLFSAERHEKVSWQWVAACSCNSHDIVWHLLPRSGCRVFVVKMLFVSCSTSEGCFGGRIRHAPYLFITCFISFWGVWTQWSSFQRSQLLLGCSFEAS